MARADAREPLVVRPGGAGLAHAANDHIGKHPRLAVPRREIDARDPGLLPAEHLLHVIEQVALHPGALRRQGVRHEHLHRRITRRRLGQRARAIAEIPPLVGRRVDQLELHDAHMPLVLPPIPRDRRARRHEYRLLDPDAHLLARDPEVRAAALRLGDVLGRRADQRPLDLLVAEDHQIEWPRRRFRVRHDLDRQDEPFLASESASDCPRQAPRARTHDKDISGECLPRGESCLRGFIPASLSRHFSLSRAAQGRESPSAFAFEWSVVRRPLIPFQLSTFSVSAFPPASVVRLQALLALCGSLVGALLEPCWSLVGALWSHGVALGSQSVGYQQALGSH